MAVGAIKHNLDVDIELFIPYFPYSRQDRVCSDGEAFSLKIITDIFNNLNLKKIITYDVHSIVAGILLDKLEEINNHLAVRSFIEDCGLPRERRGIALICPDAGAVKKAHNLYHSLPHLFDTLIYCNKIRRQDGSITIGDIKSHIRDMDCVIVDDICDGGATFVELGKRLNDANVSGKYLFVSHGIFSKGVKELNGYYDEIGTTNSIKPRKYQHIGVRVYDLDY